MVIRDTPKDKSKYIMVKSKSLNDMLQRIGYHPMFVDSDGVYYKKSNMLNSVLNILQKGGAD